MERHDFEILAKIHKDGVEGMHKNETIGYWCKISQHLKQQESEGTTGESATWSFFSTERNAKQDSSSKLPKKTTPVLSPISSNTLPSSRIPRPSCATQPKQQLPLIQTLKPKLFRRALLTEEKKSAVNLCSSGARPSSTVREATSCKKTANKRLQQTSYFQLNNSIKLGHAFNLGFCHSSRAERVEKAAIFVQALWRMRCARQKYIRMRNAAILLQKSWRKHISVLSCQQKIQRREAEDLNCPSGPCFKVTPVCAEKQGYVKLDGSPCELLYRADISPNQEDELFTELVSLLNLDAQSPAVESCDSFRFSRSLDEVTEACTPKMKPDSRDSPFRLPDVSAEKRAAKPDCPSLLFVEDTPLVIKQALLSPVMEREIISELAKLFPLCKGNFQENLPSTSSVSLTGSGQSFEPMDTKVSILQEQHENDGIIRRLMFNTTEVEKKGRMNVENAAVANVSTLERQGDSCGSRFSSHSSLIQMNSNTRSYDKELNDITIPLLVDQSPLLTSKRHVRYQNPCNRKVEKALVSSFGDWRYSFSSVEDYEDHEAFKEGVQVNCYAETQSSPIGMVTSKEFFSSSRTKSSSILKKQSQFATFSKTTTTAGGDSCRKTPVSVDFFTDCLLETCDVKSSMVYAKAIFQCPKFPLYDDEEGVLLEKSNTRCGAARCGNSVCCPAITSDTRLASLHQHLLQGAGNVAADIQLELDYLEALPKKLEEDSKRSELVRHQRDTIYTNIAAFYDVQARQRLYDKWEIQKLLTGRLKKIVYELLWTDPQRYQESAELVIKNL